MNRILDEYNSVNVEVVRPVAMMEQKRVSVTQAIAHRLEQIILDGTLKPGQKIPSERRLSSRLGVSRSLVREALHALQGRGVIITQHGKGSFVRTMVSEPDDDGALLQLFFGHNRTLYDLYEVRAQLEGQAAALAAERATTEDQYRITKAFESMEIAKDNDIADSDHAFHETIAAASHNPVLVHVLSSLKGLMLHSVEASTMNLNHRKPFKKQIDKHHRQIYHAVISKQPQWAQKAAKSHVDHVCNALKHIEKEEKIIYRSKLK